MFGRLADSLAGEGFSVFRFSFRGHGRSDGTQQGVTIAGEILDLRAALDAARKGFDAPLSVVAASFGAVSTCLSLPYVEDELRSLVLWNPVLDLHRTFIEPSLSWAVENFGPAQQTLLDSQGFFLVEGTFEVGRVLFQEMRHYRPVDGFASSRMPALVVHGDRDSAVPYDIALAAADARGSCDFHTVHGSDHGFNSREHEDEAIAVTAAWLAERYGV